jgi:WD40 repeat protein
MLDAQLEQLELLHQVIRREAHVLALHPSDCISHLYLRLALEPEATPTASLLELAFCSLATRSWLRLVNRPEIPHAALFVTLDDPVLSGGPAWSPDADLVATGSRDGHVRIWDPNSGRLLMDLAGHKRSVGALAWSPDGMLIASAQSTPRWAHAENEPLEPDKVLVRTRDGAFSARLAGPTGETRELAWSTSGRYLACLTEGDVTLFDREAAWAATKGDSFACGLAWRPGTDVLASLDVVAGRLSEALGKTVNVSDVHDLLRASITAASWAPDGSKLATGDLKGQVHVWHFASGRFQRLIHDDAIKRLAWSPDGGWLAVAEGRTIDLWNASAWEPTNLGGHRGTVHALAWHPDGTCLASASRQEIVIWNPTAPKRSRRRVLALQGTQAFSWSPDGMLIAEQTNIWDQSLAGLRMDPQCHRSEVSTAVWSPDKSLFASVDGEDHAARVWDGRTGKPVARLQGHTTPPMDLAWFPDGETVATASGGTDLSVRVWEARSGRCRSILAWESVKRSRVPQSWSHRWTHGLAVSPDGKALWLTTGSGDFLWEEGRSLRRYSTDVGTVTEMEPISGEERPSWAHTRSHQRGMLEAASPNGELVARTEADAITVTDARGRDLGSVRCLSPIVGVEFDDEERMLHVVDSGGATGNRPVPYVLEVTAAAEP